MRDIFDSLKRNEKEAIVSEWLFQQPSFVDYLKQSNHLAFNSPFKKHEVILYNNVIAIIKDIYKEKLEYYPIKHKHEEISFEKFKSLKEDKAIVLDAQKIISDRELISEWHKMDNDEYYSGNARTYFINAENIDSLSSEIKCFIYSKVFYFQNGKKRKEPSYHIYYFSKKHPFTLTTDILEMHELEVNKI